ncbi:Uncharacterized BCR%2C YitT family COG1284 [uncultured Clostridium sp.]|nr:MULTISPECIES: hypothetical protein [unclassified Romboutsia]SCI13820.1 Uncharacterized BCR%2C YitT family COG1284 [uncultured Clostridium sp.]
MKKLLILIIKLISGFFLCAMGTVMAIKSNLGLSPWDVFHQGISNISGFTIGQVSIFVGIIVVAISYFLGCKIGFGTISNMIVIGLFIDFITYLNFIPNCNSLLSGIIMIIGSLFISAIGAYLYIGCAMGCGPRDGLMVTLMQITNKPIKIIRGILEVTVLMLGWILGGLVGIGTLITAFGIGYCLQLTFKLLKFDVSSIHQKNLRDGFIFVKECLINEDDKPIMEAKN